MERRTYLILYKHGENQLPERVHAYRMESREHDYAFFEFAPAPDSGEPWRASYLVPRANVAGIRRGGPATE